MFNPSLTDVRNFFFACYRKGTTHQPLSALEQMAFGLILAHPEYTLILADHEKYLNYTWSPQAGETNPFLHLSMHLSILEQLSINQPLGIKELYLDLCTKLQDEHAAQHQVMDCLAEVVWQSQRSNLPPDPQGYLACLRAKLGVNPF